MEARAQVHDFLKHNIIWGFDELTGQVELYNALHFYARQQNQLETVRVLHRFFEAAHLFAYSHNNNRGFYRKYCYPFYDINFILWTPDSQRVVTVVEDNFGGADDGELMIWNIFEDTYHTFVKLQDGHADIVEISPNGRYIKIEYADYTNYIYELDTGKLVLETKAARLIFSHNDTIVTGITNYFDRDLSMHFSHYDVKTGKIIDPPQSFYWSLDKFISATDYNQNDPYTGKKVTSPDGKWIATYGGDNSFRIWDASNFPI